MDSRANIIIENILKIGDDLKFSLEWIFKSFEYFQFLRTILTKYLIYILLKIEGDHQIRFLTEFSSTLEGKFWKKKLVKVKTSQSENTI